MMHERFEKSVARTVQCHNVYTLQRKLKNIINAPSVGFKYMLLQAIDKLNYNDI